MRIEREQARQVGNSGFADPAFDIGADAGQVAQFQAEKTLWQILRAQNHQSIRLLQFGADLCEITIRRNADRAALMGTDIFCDPSFDRAGDFGRTPDRDFVIYEAAGHLVYRTDGANRDMLLDLFDKAMMKLDIALMSSQHADQVGTKPPGFVN